MFCVTLPTPTLATNNHPIYISFSPSTQFLIFRSSIITKIFKMSSPQNTVNFPRPPPPSSPDDDTTVVVVVFVSFGCLFFLAFLLVALFCFIKRKKAKKTVQETDIVLADEHMKVNEAVVPGPHGTKAVVLTIEDDVHIEEVIRKNEKLGKGTHAKSGDNIVSELGAGEPSSSSSGPHHDKLKP